MHHRLVTVGEAERMLERGECNRARMPGKKSVGRTRPVYRLVPQVEPSTSDCTPAAITVFDLEASLGMRGTPEERKAAREKLDNYCETH